MVNSVRLHDILRSKAALSPKLYRQVHLQSERHKSVRDFLTGIPMKGHEVGSGAYIRRSPKGFVRTKALQPESFTPQLIGDAVVPILPSSFRDMELSAGDMIMSKDSNVGAVAILDQDYPDHMLSGGLLRLPVEEHKTYLFAFFKHRLFHDQLVNLVPPGATIHHAKDFYLDCDVPLPAIADEGDVFSCVDVLVQMVVRRESQIRQNERLIRDMIETELASNQRFDALVKAHPRIAEVSKTGRLDAGFYRSKHGYGQFMVANYRNGSGTVEDWGFRISRGQNLQVSAIGQSIYADTPKEGYYTLVRPTNFSDYGTVTRFEYLGNPRNLSCIADGDIVFSAEGSIGKCVLFVDSKEKLITNIHGIILRRVNQSKKDSAFLSCFLRYLRYTGVLDQISVGGQGGSLGEKYWADVRIPFFPSEVRNQIASIYYQAEGRQAGASIPFDEWLKQDGERVVKTDTLRLQKQLQELKGRITQIIDSIAIGEAPETDLSFVYGY